MSKYLLNETDTGKYYRFNSELYFVCGASNVINRNRSAKKHLQNKTHCLNRNDKIPSLQLVGGDDYSRHHSDFLHCCGTITWIFQMLNCWQCQ